MDSFHRFLPSVLVVSTLVVSAALADRMPVNQAAIDGVKSGELNTATASWWGFDPEDSTEALRSAINSGAKKLTVDNMGSPWIVEPMQLASNQEILFQKGVVVQAKRGSFKGTGDCLFTAAVKENITLSGYGATLRMWKEDYHTDAYQKAEWRHTLSVRSSKNVKVLGLTLANSGGDGIYLGVSQKGVTNKGVHIKDVVCADHNRQGISVITAEDLLIEDTILKDTRGTAPQAGIDFEPNDPSERLVNCVMRNCVSENNAGDAYDFYIPTLHASSAPVSIRLENCRSVGGMRAVSITTGNDPRTAVNGKIEFVNCRFEGSEHAGIVVNRKPATGCEVQFANCVVADAALKQPMQTPILLGNAANDTEDIGGVEFADLVVVDPVDRNPMSYLDLAGGLALVDVTGSVSVERDGKRSTYTIDQKLIDQWMPHRTCKRFPRFVTEVCDSSPPFPMRTGRASEGKASRGSEFTVSISCGQKRERMQNSRWSLNRWAGTPSRRCQSSSCLLRGRKSPYPRQGSGVRHHTRSLPKRRERIKSSLILEATRRASTRSLTASASIRIPVPFIFSARRGSSSFGFPRA